MTSREEGKKRGRGQPRFPQRAEEKAFLHSAHRLPSISTSLENNQHKTTKTFVNNSPEEQEDMKHAATENMSDNIFFEVFNLMPSVQEETTVKNTSQLKERH